MRLLARHFTGRIRDIRTAAAARGHNIQPAAVSATALQRPRATAEQMLPLSSHQAHADMACPLRPELPRRAAGTDPVGRSASVLPMNQGKIKSALKRELWGTLIWRRKAFRRRLGWSDECQVIANQRALFREDRNGFVITDIYCLHFFFLERDR